jgi:hypothetical protein
MNAAKAIRNDISSGKGCGKIGINDSPNIMPMNVTIKVNNLSDFCLSARSISSFFLCFLLLYQARGWKMGKLRSDFKANQSKTLIWLTVLKACCGECSWIPVNVILTLLRESENTLTNCS